MLTFKFFIPQPLKKYKYFHSLVVLAEGFSEKGITFYGNADYWYEPKKFSYLINKAPEGFEADVHIYMPVALFDKTSRVEIDHSKITIVVDNGDGMFSYLCNKELQKVDLVLRSQFNANFNYFPNTKPWAFGLSNRIISAIDSTRGQEKELSVLSNFRGPHTSRKLVWRNFLHLLEDEFEINNRVEQKLAPEDFEDGDIFGDTEKSYWIQTCQRHNSSYFQRLNSSTFTLSFGGFIMRKPIAKIKNRFPFKQFFKRQVLLPGLDINAKKYFYYQYDSWRFWEAMYADSVPVHVDFEEWGFVVPAMPVDGKHYIGIRNFDFKEGAARLKSLSAQEIQAMAEEGSRWVREHYSPTAMVSYLLEYLKEEEKI